MAGLLSHVHKRKYCCVNGILGRDEISLQITHEPIRAVNLDKGPWRTLEHVLKALLHKLVRAADQRQAIYVVELRSHLRGVKQPVSHTAGKFQETVACW